MIGTPDWWNCKTLIGGRSACHPALAIIEQNTENSEEKDVEFVDEPADVEEEERQVFLGGMPMQ